MTVYIIITYAHVMRKKGEFSSLRERTDRINNTKREWEMNASNSVYIKDSMLSSFSSWEKYTRAQYPHNSSW